MHFSSNCNKFLECAYSFGVFVSQMRVGFQIYVPFFDNHHVTAYDGIAGATWRMIVYYGVIVKLYNVTYPLALCQQCIILLRGGLLIDLSPP